KAPCSRFAAHRARGIGGLDAAVEGLKTSGVNPRCKCFSRACKPRRCLNVCLNATPYLMLCLELVALIRVLSLGHGRATLITRGSVGPRLRCRSSPYLS